MAKQYVQALEEPFRPEEFTDTYREGLQALIAAKETMAPAATPATATTGRKVVDIMDALRKSLETAKEKQAERKPAVSEATTKKPRKRKA